VNAVHSVERQEPESRVVVAWRFEELLRAGYPERDAMALALETGVDLHAATELVRRGCQPETAIRILT
jgi:hypothetical protein